MAKYSHPLMQEMAFGKLNYQSRAAILPLLILRLGDIAGSVYLLVFAQLVKNISDE